MVRRNRKSRGRGLRTTNGCLTCRKRHIKCDEEKPFCGPCVKNDKSCNYALFGNRSVATPETVSDAPQPTQHQPSETHQPPATAGSTPRDFISNEESQSSVLTWAPPDPDEIVHLRPAPDRLPGSVQHTHRSPTTLQNDHISSPGASNVSPLVTAESIESPGPTINAAAVRWFGLLANDAALEGPQLSTALIGYGNDCISFDNTAGGDLTQPTSLQRATQVLDYPHSGSAASQSPAGASPQNVSSLVGTPLEKRLWQAQNHIDLLPREHFLFKNFVQRVSQSIDLFDPTSQFATFVPHLAVRNAGLLNAIFALSCRHLSLNPGLDNGELPNGEAALQYYYQTLHYVQKAMQYPSYQVSLELLATTLIISAYEMLDNSSNDWERHLEGVFLIQRSQVIHGESGGLQAAVWWAWLCQDVWAAFREKRKTLTFWIPQKPMASLSPYELAARSVYITAKVVNFCSQDVSGADGGIQPRIDKANHLHSMLTDWWKNLTIEFSPLPVVSEEPSASFRPIWICPPAFGVAIQLYCAARILLLSHEPSLGGLSRYLERQTVIQKCVEHICGISMTLKDDASSLVSSQALFIAGMFTQDAHAREAVLELLDSCRQRSGWPVKPLGDELQQLWKAPESPKSPGLSTFLQF